MSNVSKNPASTSKETKSGSRSYHKKSRNGCAQCKRIHKKCDENPPRCGNCSRRGMTCEYETMRPPSVGPRIVARASRFTQSATPPSSLSPDYSFSSSPVPATQAQFNCFSAYDPFTPAQTIPDAILMTHYQAHTFRTFAMQDIQDCQDLWQYTIPREAEHHEFLRQAVLAISASHSAHCYPTDAESYAMCAKGHHEQAMALFQSAGNTITADNATAVVCFAFFQVLYRFGSPFIPGVSCELDVIDSFTQVIAVISLFWCLLPEALPLISDPQVRHMVSEENLMPLYPPSDAHIELFAALDSANIFSADSPEDKTAYKASLQELQHVYAIPIDPVKWSLILLWPVRSPSHVMTLLHQRQNLALIHLAYWCVPIHRACSAPQQWFMSGWSRRTIFQIARSVDAEFRPLMDWPLHQLGYSAVPTRVGSASGASDPSTSMSPPHVERRASDR